MAADGAVMKRKEEKKLSSFNNSVIVFVRSAAAVLQTIYYHHTFLTFTYLHILYRKLCVCRLKPAESYYIIITVPREEPYVMSERLQVVRGKLSAEHESLS